MANFIFKIQPIKPITALPGAFILFSTIHATLCPTSLLCAQESFLTGPLREAGSSLKIYLPLPSLSAPASQKIKKTGQQKCIGLHYILIFIIVPSHITFSTLGRIFNLHLI